MCRIKQCPFCQSTDVECLHILTNEEARMSTDFDQVAEDEINKNFYQTITDQRMDHRQVVFRDKADLEQQKITFIREKDGKYYYRKTGQARAITPIVNYACAACHSLLPPAALEEDVQIRFVYLCGKTSAGKTSTLASLFSTLSRFRKAGSRRRRKSHRLPEHGFHLLSHEYRYYADMEQALRRRKAPMPTVASMMHWNRQPLFFMRMGNVLYVLIDAPGEAFRSKRYVVTDDSIMLLMMPCVEKPDTLPPPEAFYPEEEQDTQEDSMMQMLRKAKGAFGIEEEMADTFPVLKKVMHAAGADVPTEQEEPSAADIVCDVAVETVQAAAHVILNFTQCDTVDAAAVRHVMLGSCTDNGRALPYTDLMMTRSLMARGGGALKQHFPDLYEVYDSVSGNGVSTSVIFTAALGVDAENGRMLERYQPRYMTDLVYNIVYAARREGSDGE